MELSLKKVACRQPVLSQNVYYELNIQELILLFYYIVIISDFLNFLSLIYLQTNIVLGYTDNKS